jgi:hypothetical protein
MGSFRALGYIIGSIPVSVILSDCRQHLQLSATAGATSTAKLQNSLFGSCRLDARRLTDGQADRLDEGTALQTFVTNAHKNEKKDVNNAVSGRYRRD